MSFLRRIMGLAPPPRAAPPAPPREADAEAGGISFHQLQRQLSSPDPGARAEAALLLSALRRPEALQALVRAFVEQGDAAVLESLAAYGDRVTPVAAREARDLSLGARQRARALALLGRLADPAARAALRAAAVDPDPVVHIAAGVALVQVGDELGEARLRAGLEARPAGWRAAALRALREAEHPRAEALAEEHVRRYLALGGAIPAAVAVAMPLFLDLGADLAHRLGGYVAAARVPFVLVTGPGTADLAETQRETLAPYLGGRRLFYTTARHSAPEQVEVLEKARAAVAGLSGGVVHVGPVPDPEGIHALPDFLGRPRAARDAALVVYVGPLAGTVVVAWWRFLAERSAVPATLSVLLTQLALGGPRLGAEAWELYQRCLGPREAAFARAYLAQLPESD